MRLADLQWSSAPMPDASGPVSIATLPARRDGWFRAIVRFPRGWSREIAGHYPVAEEFAVLEGGLTIDAHAWCLGALVRIPGGVVRAVTRADRGCLALATFEGFPKWVRGAPVPPVHAAIAHRTLDDPASYALERAGLRL